MRWRARGREARGRASGGPPALDALASARGELYGSFFGAHAATLAGLCHAMAERFARGGRLVAFGAGAADRSDVRHVAVEFVQPVIVGKRALPALGLDPADAALLLEPDDIAMAFGAGPEVERAMADAAARGCDTVAFSRVGARTQLVPDTDDPFAAQEAAETAYHVLWELVHVFFEHRGLLAGRAAEPTHDPGASSFLYPFLTEREDDLGAVLADVRASVLLKAAEVSELRERTLAEFAGVMRAAAADARAALDAGGTRARARQRRLGDRRDGRRRRPAPSAGRAGLAGAAGARPDRGPGDPHRDRQRHRRRGDLRPPGHRPRPGGRRRAGDLDERRVGERARPRWPRGGGAGCSPSRSSATTAGGSPPRASPTT